jgi:hypothetical protein
MPRGEVGKFFDLTTSSSCPGDTDRMNGSQRYLAISFASSVVGDATYTGEGARAVSACESALGELVGGRRPLVELVRKSPGFGGGA